MNENPSFIILTKASSKLKKSRARGHISLALYLAPANLSGHEVCPGRTAGCTFSCINTAGQGGMVAGNARTPQDVFRIGNEIQRARINRTRLFFIDREEFWRRVVKDLNKLTRDAADLGLVPSVRMNGTSDIVWEKIEVKLPREKSTGQNIFQMYPHLNFYDYTKLPAKARDFSIPNYRLCYSWHEDVKRARRDSEEYFQRGFSCAVVFDIPMIKGKRNPYTIPLPQEWRGRQVIDGDIHDLRYLDPPACWIGLRVKGFGFLDDTGFVQKSGMPGSLGERKTRPSSTWKTNPSEQIDYWEGGSLFADV